MAAGKKVAGSAVQGNQITEGVIWKQILIFFFPILFGTFFQQLYNTADAMIVGRFVGKEALAAVGGTTGTLINLLIGFFVGLSSGATVIISQFYGAKNGARVHDAVHTAIAFSIVGGVVLTAAGILISRFALEAMKTPADVIDHALVYIRVYFAGTIANLIYNIGSSILRAIGDSRRPLYYLIACCFANIILDVVFVVFFKLGVLGVALGTVLSQVLSAFLVLRTLMKTDDVYKLTWKDVRMNGLMLKRMVQIGFPAGLQSVMYTVSNIIVQTGVNTLGTDAAAAWATYGKVDGLFWMMISALGIAATTFVGQNYGAGKTERVHRGVGVCVGLGIIMTLIMCAALYFGGYYLIVLFTGDQAVRGLCMELLHFMVPTFVTYLAIEILSGALRGVGDCWIPMMITGIGVCGIRVIWILLALPVKPHIITAAFCYPLTWVITSVAFIIYYRWFSKLKGGRNKWRKANI